MFADLVILNRSSAVDRLFPIARPFAVRQRAPSLTGAPRTRMKAYIEGHKVIDAQGSWCFLAPMIPTCTHAIPVYHIPSFLDLKRAPL